MRSTCCATAVVSLRPLIPHKSHHQHHPHIKLNKTSPQFSKTHTNNTFASVICCSINNGQQDSSPLSSSTTQQLNLSVLRFTFGIPGLDESYLPRWIGYAFGSLLLLNHFLGSDLSGTTPAQLRTEVLGLSLAAFSVIVPYLGKFLKGATLVTEKNVPEGAEQIFVMSQNISDTLKEDLAWGTFILLRNTNSISVAISIQDAICVRGYWNVSKDVSKDQATEWLKKQIQQTGLCNSEDTLYFPQAADTELRELLPDGTRSLLVQPVRQAGNLSSEGKDRTEGFLLLASGNDYAYTEKDRAWIGAIANKFRGSRGVVKAP